QSACTAYCTDPSPAMQTTGRCGCAICTPTAADNPKPSPPPAPKNHEPGRDSFSRLRTASVADGASTTAIASSGHTSASACTAAPGLMGSDSSGSGGGGSGS